MKPGSNGGLQLGEAELNELIHRLQNISPRNLDEHKLRKAFGKSKSNSLGSEKLLEETSEYEPFAFPRSPSHNNRGVAGVSINLHSSTHLGSWGSGVLSVGHDSETESANLAASEMVTTGDRHY